MSEKTRLYVNVDEFEIKNNPVYIIFREQWNADLLENFTLNKFNNPNANRIYTPQFLLLQDLKPALLKLSLCFLIH